MTELDTFFSLHGADLITAVLIAIVVLGYMVYRDWSDGKFDRDRSGRRVPNTGDPVLNRFLKEISESMRGLQAHYNDDTTRLLAEIQSEHSQQFGLIRSVKDDTERANTKIDEMMKYGIPTYYQRNDRTA